MTSALIAACCAVAAASPPPSAPPAVAPATRRAHEMVALINSGDARRVRTYADTAFGEPLRRDSLAEHVTFILTERERSRGLQWIGPEREAPDSSAAALRRQLTGRRIVLDVAVEPSAPYRIVSYGIRTPTLDSAASLAPTSGARAMAADIDRLAARLAAADAFSGTVLLARHGRILFARAYGEANKEFAAPNRLDTRFNLGSMGKMFTAVAIAQLAEQGKLSLDDSLGRFLPPGSLRPEVLARVRVKHLLSHTSGLGDIFTEEFDRTPRMNLRTIDDIMRLTRTDSLQFEPGTRWAYSNTGFTVLGKIIEIVSGEDYFQYVRDHLFAPAGMTKTDSYDLDRAVPNRAVGYEKRFAENGAKWFIDTDYWQMIRGSSAGGGYSTVEDLLRFAQALAAGKLVSPTMMALLTTPKPELASPRYGYGFQLRPELGVVGHGGGAPGVSANLDIFGTTGYVAVVLSNYGLTRDPLVERMRGLVRARIDREVKAPQ